MAVSYVAHYNKCREIAYKILLDADKRNANLLHYKEPPKGNYYGDPVEQQIAMLRSRE